MILYGSLQTPNLTTGSQLNIIIIIIYIMPLTYRTLGGQYQIASYSTLFPPASATLGTITSSSVQITNIVGPTNFTFSIIRNGTTIATGQTGTTYTDTGLSPNTSYTYQIVTTNASVTSNAVTIGTAITTAAPYVLAFAGSTIYKTTNGTTFTTFSTNLTTLMGSVMQIVYGNSVYVAVGSGTHCVAYSSDAVTWTGAGTPLAPVTSVAFGPAPGLQASGSVFIGTGPKTNGQTGTGTAGNTTLVWSSNGVTWTGILSASAVSLFTGNTGGRIIYNTKLSMWIADQVNNNNNAALIGYSTDGLNWTPLSISAFSGANGGLGLDYNPTTGLTVACGYAYNGSNYVQTVMTTTGTTWQNSASPFGTANNQAAFGVAYGSGIFIVVGGVSNSTNIIHSSSDGYTWTARLAQQAGSNDVRSVVYSNGFNTWYVGSVGSNIYYSQNNGASWTTLALANAYYGFFAYPN